MAIQYSMHIDGDTLRVKAVGQDDNAEEVKAYGMAIIEAAVSSNCTHALCDETELVYTLGTFDTFDLAEFIAAYAPAVSKAAVVCNPEFLEDAQFFETVTYNRGLELRIFSRFDEAQAWLDQ